MGIILESELSRSVRSLWGLGYTGGEVILELGMNRGRRSFWNLGCAREGSQAEIWDILGGRLLWDGEWSVFPCPLNWGLM